jgi:uncharacterized protein YcaQ
VENRDLFERAATGALRFSLTTFLSPFDPLIWDRARAKQVFDFEYSLECYTPAPKRRFGYYVLPILRRGRLVGRMDAKASRADEVFEVRRMALEENVRHGASLVADIAAALREIAKWHGTPAISLGRVEPAAFARDLRKALGSPRSQRAPARTDARRPR